MNKLIITLVCAFVVYMAHALNLNQDSDGICHAEQYNNINKPPLLWAVFLLRKYGTNQTFRRKPKKKLECGKNGGVI